jgi:hypothetical protein
MKNAVDRQPNAFVVGGSGSMAPRAPVHLASVQRASRIRDAVVAGYIGLALAVLGYDFVQARRFESTLGRLRSCVAQANSACTSAELEAARRIRNTDVRLEIGEASLGVLLHETDRAAATEAVLEAQQKQDATPIGTDVRADLLLLRGDIATSKGDLTSARGDFEAAKPLLTDPSLVTVRLKRIEAGETLARAHSADELEDLHKDFSDLFDGAEQGEHDITDLRIAKAQEWVGRVTHVEARQELALAIDAARRASSIVESNNRSTQLTSPLHDPPKAPVRGVVDYSSGYYGSYDAQVATYRDKLDRYNKDRAAADERQRQRSAEASQTSSAALGQAKNLLDKALLTLQTLPEPLNDAATSAAVPARAPITGGLPILGRRFVPGMYPGGSE